MKKNTVGTFFAISGFLLTPDQTYGIIGDLKSGKLREGNFINVPLNSTISICAEIDKVQTIRMSGSEESHQVLFVNTKDNDTLFCEFLDSLRVEAELLEITLTGE